MPKKKVNPATERKRRVRSTPEGRVYDRARNRALTKVAQSHPDEYEKVLRTELATERRRIRSAQLVSA